MEQNDLRELMFTEFDREELLVMMSERIARLSLIIDDTMQKVRQVASEMRAS